MPKPELRVNFATIATPEFWRIKEVDFDQISLKMIQAADPDRLRRSLIDVSQIQGGLVVGYLPDNSTRERKVPLYPVEYGIISRTPNPGQFGEIAVARLLKGTKGTILSPEQSNADAEQSMFEAIEGQLGIMQKYRIKGLKPQIAQLDRLLESAEYPGLNRRLSDDARVGVTTVTEWILPQVFKVIGRQRGWNDSQHMIARKALEKRLFFKLDGINTYEEWRKLFCMVKDYTQEKINLFEDREGRFERYLIDNGRLDIDDVKSSQHEDVA